MTSEQDHVLNTLEYLGASLRERPALKDRIIQRIVETDTRQSVELRRWYRRRVPKAVAGMVACVLVVVSLWQMAAQNGASQVFAAALENVRQARSFSCKRTDETTKNGKKHITEKLFMFKEPDLERDVLLTSPSPQFNGEVTILDYANRKELRLLPTKNVAYLTDRNSDYVVDESTGNLKHRELDTSIRDRLLQWSTGNVEDLGNVDLQDKSVRLLKSRWGKWDLKIWIDPNANLPIQVVLREPGGEVETYSSFQIDVELDDDLFSMVPPDGYRLERVNTGWSDYQSKLSAKMSFLVLECQSFRHKHDNKFPEVLSDLKARGIKEEILKVILASPNQPDGAAIIHYRRPPADVSFSTFIILHEVFDKWPKEGLVVCFADGHREIIADQAHFEQLL